MPPILDLESFAGAAKPIALFGDLMNSDTTTNLIIGRRSVRVYSPGQIGETIVTTLLEAAMAAPSAMTKDPWRFVIVRQRKTLSQLSSLHPGAAMLSTAALAIVVCGDLEAAFDRSISYLLQDCAAAIENLLLAAHGLGLGACWVGVHPAEAAIKQVKELLALPPSIVPVAVVSLGHPGEDLPPRTRFKSENIHLEKW